MVIKEYKSSIKPKNGNFGMMEMGQRQPQRDLATLSDYYSDNEDNNLDFNEITRMAQYRECVAILQKKCETISRDNERIVKRLHYVKKITKRKEKDVALLKSRLDDYNDEWRTAQPDPSTKVQPSHFSHLQFKMRKPKMPKKSIDPVTGLPIPKPPKPEKGSKPGPKRKKPKSEKEKDPNAPKRPANPFFQFCQEQRSMFGEQQPKPPELSKQELTRHLASRWRSMDNDEKQIYIDRYEDSKQKYNHEMQSYKKNG